MTNPLEITKEELKKKGIEFEITRRSVHYKVKFKYLGVKQIITCTDKVHEWRSLLQARALVRRILRTIEAGDA